MIQPYTRPSAVIPMPRGEKFLWSLTAASAAVFAILCGGWFFRLLLAQTRGLPQDNYTSHPSKVVAVKILPECRARSEDATRVANERAFDAELLCKSLVKSEPPFGGHHQMSWLAFR